ncbi:MAG: hypothetical protein II945_08425 [Bacteroidales bacterium]|nr:hypothetical protein [Bacteroidales bacterium]
MIPFLLQDTVQAVPLAGNSFTTWQVAVWGLIGVFMFMIIYMCIIKIVHVIKSKFQPEESSRETEENIEA